MQLSLNNIFECDSLGQVFLILIIVQDISQDIGSKNTKKKLEDTIIINMTNIH